MSGFPGNIYGLGRKSLDRNVPDLAQGEINGYPHRCIVSYRKLAPIACMWLLTNDATSAAISHVLMIEAVKLVLAGKGIMIMARRPQPEVDVRTGLLRALDLFAATQDVAGRA